jgi:excinuclease ABC subunit B
MTILIPPTGTGQRFDLVAPFQMTGDQPGAVDQIAERITEGDRFQALKGVTGSGKTFTMANIVQRVQRPTLVMAHNKTLAAQLCMEFREFFPNNAVEYFVSYYDYYQPEAYVARTDTYIEKDAEINNEIDRLRHAATKALWERRDVLIVASVSCIYGLGAPDEYASFIMILEKGARMPRDVVIRRLIDMQYERNDYDVTRAKFRVRGDTLELQPVYEELAVRVEFFGDEIERIVSVDPTTGEVLGDRDRVALYPAKHWVTGDEKLTLAIRDAEEEMRGRVAWFQEQGKLVEAQRLEQRTRYDLEMMREVGYCSGIENYSRHLQQRPAGSRPWCLLDYFPKDFLLFVDESHMTVPQVRGMFHGDMARKQNLVDFGFRMPSALDNRPLNYTEFEQLINQAVFVSATPAAYEQEISSQVVEQLIRPTGLTDPSIEVKPTEGQIDDLLYQVRERVGRGERALVTTLTKRMAEQLGDYLKEMGIKTHYIHSDVETLERSEILRDLRLGVYDVIVGINLLREGLDLPEVSLVAILDADKEGYLRSGTSLIQTIGRAARHVNGHVIMYADQVTDSMLKAIEETYRRRELQASHNVEHGIVPQGIQKAVRDITERVRHVAETRAPYQLNTGELPKEDLARIVYDLEKQMKQASKNLEFEKAAAFRDQMVELRRVME